MRILHISTRLILGGSQENTVLSCEGQANLGHDVHLAFGPIYGPEGSLLDRVNHFRTEGGNGRGITTHIVPHLEREIMPRADRRCYAELRDLIRTLKPDIVHTHSSKAGILGRGAAWRELYARPRSLLQRGNEWSGLRRRNWPCGIIHTIHGPPFHQYQSSLKNALYIASERWAARRCHLIVSVADAMTQQYLGHRIGNPGQYVTVYSGMETESFLTPAEGESREEVRARLGLAPSEFVIGTVARLAELKGHDDLLEALGEHLRANRTWKLLWVGDGWWRDRLMARVTEMGLKDSVIVTGLVPPTGRGGVPGFMRAMDLLVHPSYREGLPRTVPQALLCGTPVVAYDVDGTSEVVLDEGEGKEDHATGLLVDAGDIDGLEHAVRWMADHPRERAEMAQRGRDLCRERFSAERMVAELEKVYERALAMA
jgi:glycosyltransferase involved in cell wall biosynthesis